MADKILNDKVMQAISDALPETQVAMIKDALIERDTLRIDNGQLTGERDQYKAWWFDKDKQLSKLSDELAKTTEALNSAVEQLIEYQEKDVEARVKLAEGKLEAVNDTVDKFLKNTIYRESLQHQIADEYTTVQTHYGPDGRPVPVPTPGKTHRTVVDTKETTKE